MAESLSNKHPEYGLFFSDWILMRDAYKGQRAVKQKKTLYLSATAGHIEDGYAKSVDSVGHKAYVAYQNRARFPGHTREAIQMAVGMMFNQPPEIELPEAMQGIRSSRGESLPNLLRRINTEQLITGRIGLMADLPKTPVPGDDLPRLSTYIAERIINWDDGVVDQLVPQVLNLIVLDESEHERADGFNWQKSEKYRVLIIGKIDENVASAVYRQGIFDENGFTADKLMTPQWKGRELEKIPFVIINSADLVNNVDDPPLLDLGNLCMTIYQSDADYRLNLFMQGQDTFVTIGGSFAEDDVIRTGAGSRVDLPQGADAKYVGVQSSGLSEQRQALDQLNSRASSMGAQTLDTTSRERESGDSLRIRVAARTADMNQITETGAQGLEDILKICAEWMDEDPEKVSVVANKEFGEIPLTGQTMVEMATARNLGFPLSGRSLHEIAVKRHLTNRTYEEEIAAAEAEKDSIFKPRETGDRAEEQPNAKD